MSDYYKGLDDVAAARYVDQLLLLGLDLKDDPLQPTEFQQICGWHDQVARSGVWTHILLLATQRLGAYLATNILCQTGESLASCQLLHSDPVCIKVTTFIMSLYIMSYTMINACIYIVSCSIINATHYGCYQCLKYWTSMLRQQFHSTEVDHFYAQHDIVFLVFKYCTSF